MTPILMKNVLLYTKGAVSYLEAEGRMNEAKTLTISYVYINSRFLRGRYSSDALHSHIAKLVEILEEQGDFAAARMLMTQFLSFNEGYAKRHLLFNDDLKTEWATL